MSAIRSLAALLALCAWSASPAPGQKWDTLGEEGARILASYIRVNTSNPPGNEGAAAAYLRAILEAEGVATTVWEPAPGKANLVARLPGTGRARPVILLHHMDVVPADTAYWSVDPFGGLVREGFVWGRGAIDTKGLGVAQLMALLALKRSGITLDRDVILLATSDEEIGGVLGAGEVTRNHLAALHNAEFVLNEGASIVADEDGRIRYFGVLAAEKAPYWLELIARGPAGHGSVARANTAPNRLVRALERVRTWQTPVTVTDAVQRHFRGIAPTVDPGLRPLYEDVRIAERDPAAFARIGAYSAVHQSLLRNTVSITVLRGSSKTNVVPPEARAELDVRLLPGQDQQAFLADLRRVVADDSVEVRPLGIGWPALAASTDSDLFRAIQRVAGRVDPSAPVVPVVNTGFTDCHYFLERGITCYGFAPFRASEREWQRLHGNDERLSIENLRNGARLLYDILIELGKPRTE